MQTLLFLLYLVGVTVFAYQSGYLSFEKPSTLSRFPTFLDLLIGIFIYFFIKLLISPLILTVYLLISGGFPDEYSTLLADKEVRGWFGVVELIFSLVGLVFYTYILDYTSRVKIWEVHPAAIKKRLSFFGIGAIYWFLAFPWVFLTGDLFSRLLKQLVPYEAVDQVAVTHIRNLKDNPPLYIATILGVIIIVPVIEEIIFRGLLQRMLRKWLNPLMAIFIASLIFALLHYHPEQGVRNIELLLSIFTLSCFLGYLYERTETLWTPIGLHAFFNAFTVFLITFDIFPA